MWVETEILVRYVECDPMGVVHHSNYFTWFEIGRMQLAKEAGIDFRQAQERFNVPVINIACNYKDSARFGDVVIVETSLVRPYKALLEFVYKIRRKYGRSLLAEGKSEHVLTDKEGELLMKIPEDVKEKIMTFVGDVS